MLKLKRIKLYIEKMDKIKNKLPKYYSEKQKEAIIILLKQLANIYLDTYKGSF